MSDCSESEYANKYEQMCELFPNLKCSPDASHFDKLDEILVYSDTATICDEPDQFHFCYSGISGAMKLEYTNIIHIDNPKDKFITYRDFYFAMQKWKQPMCDHQFLEDINVENNIITLGFGS